MHCVCVYDISREDEAEPPAHVVVVMVLTHTVTPPFYSLFFKSGKFTSGNISVCVDSNNVMHVMQCFHCCVSVRH